MKLQKYFVFIKDKEKIFSYIAENLSALLHVTLKLNSAIRSIRTTQERLV
jgi:hypothetical protein